MVIVDNTANGDDNHRVPMGEGPPTREELDAYYPPKFTWEQLKVFVNSGDLGLLKRDKALQKRYDEWAKTIKSRHGTMVNYLLNVRLQWGKPDRLSALRSALEPNAASEFYNNEVPLNAEGLPMIPLGSPSYFTADIAPQLISIIQNDWPYSIPSSVEHTLIWCCLPILPPPSLLPPHIESSLPPALVTVVTARLEQDGIWGFTGLPSDCPSLSPSLVAEALPALSEWGFTLEKMVKSKKGTLEEEAAVASAGLEVQRFVQNRWKEHEWEAAWFVNPPRLQSVKGLAHVHVFAKKKNIK